MIKRKRKPVAKKSATGKKSKKTTATKTEKAKKSFPEKFPFWARLKIEKKRTTLVIDKGKAIDKKKGREVDGFVHREATHSARKGYERIHPNPDKSDSKPMYLKKPKALPKTLFVPHNKNLDMPKHLQERYEKNNKT